ncbi:low density lipoprotein receptor adapter protein 1 isoform X1 [Erpetoichthys calabaricus]|uniref:low density lipoprotein receptor adapter protein 1 isoform X1 n=1 Tax=Erpetoichthys calabaricus TaxID=27687 RepID=UPI00223450D0|nr:low density lipoprotein receptor adapter protein 1 isoform X1 [Erpetoichthys calabaricus]
MDALKSAGRAIIKSPGVPRHTWSTARHEKLPENWTDTKETLLEGMVFNVKYLGMTLVEQPKGEEMASAAIRRIVSTAKASAKRFRKVTLTVSPKGIIQTDTETNDLIEDVSIYRISYCTADKAQDKVFAYVAQSQSNETLECHAFLCPKKKIAQAVTLTVAQAFKVALDLWEMAQHNKSKKAHTCCTCMEAKPSISTNMCTSEGDTELNIEEKPSAMLFSSSERKASSRHNSPFHKLLVRHDSSDADDALDEAFSRFAKSRTKARSSNTEVKASSLGQRPLLGASPLATRKCDLPRPEEKGNDPIISSCTVK